MRTISAVVCFCGTLAAAPAEDLKSVLARVDQASAGFKTMTADVRRVYHTAVINDDTVDSGVVYLKRVRPHEYRMLIDLSKPDKRAVAVEGRKAELFYPNMKTVQEYDLGKQKGLIDQFLLLGIGSSSQDLQSGYTIRYLGSEIVAGQGTAHLELIPKSKDVLQHLSKVELWISDSGYPAQQKFSLPDRDYQVITYNNVKINPDLPDSALKLQLPKGVKREYPQKP
jgi:outer membrane lipoprotein-sorting protein